MSEPAIQSSSSTDTSSSSSASSSGPELHRALGLWAVVAFGVGDILGAGVYGLVGRISGLVGYAAWMSYVAAALAAALTGLTYAEFTARYPKAGGAAHFTQSSFRMPLLTFLVIFFVALSGLFSLATSSRVFANYGTAFPPGLPHAIKQYVVPLGFVGIVAWVAARGIVLSSFTNIICSTIEVSALLLIIFLGLRFLGSVNYFDIATPQEAARIMGTDSVPSTSLGLVLAGASLAFFAFIGFEDMSNLSEEVRDAERNVPIAICLAIAITSAIYCTISLVAVSVIPPSALGPTVTETPLIDVMKKAAPGFPVQIFSIIPAFAVFNTGLLNLVMASRILYGMARGPQGQLPHVLAYVHPKWRTPVVALALASLVTMVMIVATENVGRLAAGTTTFLLVVFALLHAGLLKTKYETRNEPRPRFQIPAIFPVLGLVICVALLTRREMQDYVVAGYLTVGALILFAVNRFLLGRRNVEAVD